MKASEKDLPVPLHRKISRSFLPSKKKVKKSLWLKLSSTFFGIQVSRAWPNPDMRRHNEGYAKESVPQKGQYIFEFEFKSLFIISWINRIFFLSCRACKNQSNFKIMLSYWSTFKFLIFTIFYKSLQNFTWWEKKTFRLGTSLTLLRYHIDDNRWQMTMNIQSVVID